MGEKICFKNLEKTEEGGIRGEFKLNKDYSIIYNGKDIQLPDSDSLSNNGLKIIIDNIKKNPDKYNSVRVVYYSSLLDEMEEEGVADRETISFTPKKNPYYSELKNRLNKDLMLL